MVNAEYALCIGTGAPPPMLVASTERWSEMGYVAGKTLFAFPTDFRYAPDSGEWSRGVGQSPYIAKFSPPEHRLELTQLIERIAKRDGPEGHYNRP